MIFDKKTCNFDLDISDISLQYQLNVLRVMDEAGARGTGLAYRPVSYRHNFLVSVKFSRLALFLKSHKY